MTFLSKSPVFTSQITPVIGLGFKVCKLSSQSSGCPPLLQIHKGSLIPRMSMSDECTISSVLWITKLLIKKNPFSRNTVCVSFTVIHIIHLSCPSFMLTLTFRGFEQRGFQSTNVSIETQFPKQRDDFLKHQTPRCAKPLLAVVALFNSLIQFCNYCVVKSYKLIVCSIKPSHSNSSKVKLQ